MERSMSPRSAILKPAAKQRWSTQENPMTSSQADTDQ